MGLLECEETGVGPSSSGDHGRCIRAVYRIIDHGFTLYHNIAFRFKITVWVGSCCPGLQKGHSSPPAATTTLLWGGPPDP